MARKFEDVCKLLPECKKHLQIIFFESVTFSKTSFPIPRLRDFGKNSFVFRNTIHMFLSQLDFCKMANSLVRIKCRIKLFITLNEAIYYQTYEYMKKFEYEFESNLSFYGLLLSSQILLWY